MPKPPEAPHARTAQEVLKALEVRPEQGLTRDQVTRRRKQYGSNQIRKTRKIRAREILYAQFRSIVVVLLAAAAVLAFAFGKLTEGVAIVAVIGVNCLIGFVSEWRAARSMEALRKMGKRYVRVRRNGEERDVTASSLVPGDLCLHEGGDMLSADLRLIEANNLKVDESVLTGESVSVAKQVDPVETDCPLTDRASMMYRGTTITEGSAFGVVVTSGMDTELGHIAEMTEKAGADEDTPLERRLNRLGHRLAWVALGAGAVVGAGGLLAGKPTLLMIETAIALGVAAIPEGLPFVATIGLARGMWLMARKQAIINRLPAVETLGATTIILSDKTGTLTENRMVVAALVTPSGQYAFQRNNLDDAENSRGRPEDDAIFSRCLEIGALCNNASVRDRDDDGEIDEAQGDPTEIALLAAAAQWGINRREKLEQAPEVREEAFHPETMMMATIHKMDGNYLYAVKGAPAAVLERCRTAAGTQPPLSTEQRETWNEKARHLARRGLRVLALADKEETSPDANPYGGLRLLGLVGLLDPPRADVRKSLEACRRAGIRVILVTGDQPETARSIAADLGLVENSEARVLTGADLEKIDALSREEKKRIFETRVFARVSPENKLHLLKRFQKRGDIVAMTGDGVNDAPALKQANIGVAMGKRGTDAAKESADMVLKNDAFSSILAAVQQGRVIFTNIRKSVIFMLCTNVAEVAAVAMASLLDWPLPIRPLQILFLNVITDVFPALALSVGKGNPEKAMDRPPRRSNESILGGKEWLAISGWSAVITVCILGALLVAVHIFHFPVARAVTVSFLTLAFAKLWFVFNLREPESRLLHNDVAENPWMWAALSCCALLLLAAVYAPVLSTALDTRRPGWKGWMVILVLSALPVLAGQVHLSLAKARRDR